MNLMHLLQKYIDAWNKSDRETLISMFHPDAIYIDTAFNETFTGDLLKAHIRGDAFKDCEHCEYVIKNKVALANDGVAFEYTMQGSNKNGQSVELHGADFLQFLNGKIIRVQEYYNWENVLKGEHIPAARKYQKSGLQTKDIARYQSVIDHLLKHDKRYRDAKLTLRDLAYEMNISTNHLSQVINSAFHVNFFELINRCRIEEAKHLLVTHPDQNGLILGIALTVGFNTTATFYNAFKKLTTLTPSQYRKLHRQK